MYWGLVAVSFVAFSCSTEFIPEMNEKMRLVPFTSEFKTTLTTIMVLDYVGCWVIEKGLKAMFSDFRPKDIAIRRPDQLEREKKRAEEALKETIRLQEEAELKKIEAIERALAEKGINPGTRVVKK